MNPSAPALPQKSGAPLIQTGLQPGHTGIEKVAEPFLTVYSSSDFTETLFSKHKSGYQMETVETVPCDLRTCCTTELKPGVNEKDF
jgi:hypothetical protein